MNYRYGISLMMLFFVNSSLAALKELSAGASFSRPTDSDTDDESVGGEGGDFVLLQKRSSTRKKLGSSDEKSKAVGSGTTLVQKPHYLDDEPPADKNDTLPSSQGPTLWRSFFGGMAGGVLFTLPVGIGMEHAVPDPRTGGKEVINRLYGVGGAALGAVTVWNVRRSGESTNSNFLTRNIDWNKVKHTVADYAGTATGVAAVFAGIVWGRGLDQPLKRLIQGTPFYFSGIVAAKAFTELSNACKPSMPSSSSSKKYLE